MLEVNNAHEIYHPQNGIKCIRPCYCHLLMPTSKKTPTSQTRMVNNDKAKKIIFVIWVILRFLQVFRQNAWSPARVDIHGLHSVANQLVAMSFHPLAISHFSVSLPVLQSPVAQAQMAQPGGVYSAGVHRSCHSGCFV